MDIGKQKALFWEGAKQIEQKHIEWFKERNDAIDNHVVLNTDHNGYLRLTFWKDSVLTEPIKTECSSLFDAIFST